MKPVVRPHLDDPRPEQDSSAERIQRRNRNRSCPVVAVERVQHTDPNRHPDRCREGKAEAEHNLVQPANTGAWCFCRCRRRRRNPTVSLEGVVRVSRAELVATGRWKCRDTAPQRNALKHLVENRDNEEDDKERVSSNNKSEADDWWQLANAAFG